MRFKAVKSNNGFFVVGYDAEIEFDPRDSYQDPFRELIYDSVLLTKQQANNVAKVLDQVYEMGRESAFADLRKLVGVNK